MRGVADDLSLKYFENTFQKYFEKQNKLIF